jgi:Xaa-Pro aminopeptidase
VVFDYGARRRRLAERMEAEGVVALFLPPSADLEYLSGVERQIPFFGQSSYAHGWANGGLFVPGADPVFVFPRMFVTFDLPERPEGELVVVKETDDGESLFARTMSVIPPSGKVAVGDRIWGETLLQLGRVVGFDRLVTGSRLVNDLRRVKDADELAAMARAIAAAEQAMAAVRPLVRPGVSMGELTEAVDAELRRAGSRCPSFTTHVFGNFGPGELDSASETARTPIPEGTSVMFDFGGVVDGYCSDFGRTVYCGDPPQEVRDAYDAVLAAHAAGLAAAAAGVPAREVNAACRRPIEEAGLGDHFKHRMGHGIGMDVHERPFLSVEDATALEPGMTFTDEPSVMWNGRFGVRIEDVIVCEESGGRRLNSYPTELVAVS